jgi:uncharacterized protein YbjT (DUF2867 family)
MILVAGATGLVGGEVCRRLGAARRPFRALVRGSSDPGRVQALRSSGAEVVVGDLKDRASLTAACRGATAVISTASSTLSHGEGDSIETVDHQGQLNLVDAAKATGVDRFVFVSFRNDPEVQFPLTQAKRAVEAALRDLNYTSIQASYFMEVWLSPALGFDYANAKVRIYGNGENKLSWVSYRDVAVFCVASVEHPAAQRAVLEFGGPEALSPLEVVDIFEKESGRTYRREHVPAEALRQQMEAATDPLQKTFAGLMLQYSRGDAIDMRGVLNQFPIRLTSVREYARQVLGKAAS